MKRFAIILISLFVLIPSQAMALAFLEGGVGLGIGGSDLKETAPTSFNHGSWNLGYTFSGRAGVSFLIVDVGVTAAFSKDAAKMTRDSSTTSIFNEVRYDVTFSHLLYGAHVGVDIPVLPLTPFIEYYPNVTAELTYSEPKAENIFVNGDKFRGKGFGVGLGWSLLPILKLEGIYRSFTFDELERSGVKTALPSSNRGELTTSMFYAGLTLCL